MLGPTLPLSTEEAYRKSSIKSLLLFPVPNHAQIHAQIQSIPGLVGDPQCYFLSQLGLGTRLVPHIIFITGLAFDHNYANRKWPHLMLTAFKCMPISTTVW